MCPVTQLTKEEQSSLSEDSICCGEQEEGERGWGRGGGVQLAIGGCFPNGTINPLRTTERRESDLNFWKGTQIPLGTTEYTN